MISFYVAKYIQHQRNTFAVMAYTWNGSTYRGAGEQAIRRVQQQNIASHNIQNQSKGRRNIYISFEQFFRTIPPPPLLFLFSSMVSKCANIVSEFVGVLVLLCCSLPPPPPHLAPFQFLLLFVRVIWRTTINVYWQAIRLKPRQLLWKKHTAQCTKFWGTG